MKVLMHLHPCLILNRLLACANIYCYSAYPSFKSRDALEPRQNAYILTNSYLAERSSVAFLARFSDGVEES